MNTLHLLFPLLIAVTSAAPRPQENSIDTTQNQSNPEYVYIQSTGPGSRTISRKDKTEPERPFETSHKLPPNLTFLLKPTDDEDGSDEQLAKVEKPEKLKKVVKRSAPAPAGAIKLDIKKLLEKYKDELATSTTTSKPSTKVTSRKGRARATQKKPDNRRVKKSAEVTTVSPVLTTSKIVPKVEDEDIPLLASGSEKQRSRIQIKKGPNGQEYEYEYVYYYYDEEDDAKNLKDKKPVNEEITNAHDGPARNEILDKTTVPSRRRTTEKPKTTVPPEVNEVVPSSTRGRNRHVIQQTEEAVGEERLPASTRFPPRSRNLNTTPQIEEVSSEKPASTSRPRIRRPQKDNGESDNVTDETQGSRGRTRANVKRPSLELVDSDTFNTNYNAAAPQSDQQGGPSFPTDLPAGPVRFLGVTPNESVNLPSPSKEDAQSPAAEQVATSTTDENIVSEKTKEQTVTEETVGATDPMDKVALDLYAISQGNQKLLGEDSNQTDAELDKEVDEDSTTETSTTTTPLPTTTTTTTTTTTPAPTTTTTTTTTTTPAPSTEGSLFGRGRYRGRLGNKKTTSHASTTEASTSEGNSKPKKFGGNRSSFGNRRAGAKTTTTATPGEEKITKENVKPVSGGRPNSRGRFGSGNRSRGRTTPSPSEESQDSNNVSPSTSAPRPLRPRPTFNVRGRTRPTPAPHASEETSPGEDNSATSEATVSTTAKSRRIQPGSHSAVRPLRPGPRLNLANRRIGNHGSTTSTEASVHEDNTTGEEESHKEEEAKEETSESAAAVDSNPINRLRNRNRIQVGTASRPKASASSPVQVRRVNPLLARKRPGQKIEPSTEEPAETQPTEASTDVEEEEPAETVAVSSTTEQPRGLSKLLAGRRRLAGNHRLPGGN